MSCYLRVSGAGLNVEPVLRAAGFEAVNVWRRGDPWYPNADPNGKKCDTSGFTVMVSDADFSERKRAIADSIAFLTAHSDAMRALANADGVEHIVLDIGVQWGGEDVVVHVDGIPPALSRLAGEFNCWILISHYPIAEESE